MLHIWVEVFILTALAKFLNTSLQDAFRQSLQTFLRKSYNCHEGLACYSASFRLRWFEYMLPMLRRNVASPLRRYMGSISESCADLMMGCERRLLSRNPAPP